MVACSHGGGTAAALWAGCAGYLCFQRLHCMDTGSCLSTGSVPLSDLPPVLDAFVAVSADITDIWPFLLSAASANPTPCEAPSLELRLCILLLTTVNLSDGTFSQTCHAGGAPISHAQGCFLARLQTDLKSVILINFDLARCSGCTQVFQND